MDQAQIYSGKFLKEKIGLTYNIFLTRTHLRYFFFYLYQFMEIHELFNQFEKVDGKMCTEQEFYAYLSTLPSIYRCSTKQSQKEIWMYTSKRLGNKV